METNQQTQTNDKTNLVISYLTLRKAIGILGISFPVILVIGSIVAGGYDEIQNSISDYYHTNMRNIFVGVLCAFGLFLFSYKGYDKIDNIFGNLGGIFALGVALFPTTPDSTLPIGCCHSVAINPLIGRIHLLSAALFFIVLSYFSLFLFTKTKPSKIFTDRKKLRNRVYKICGFIMLGCIGLIAVYFLFLENDYPQLSSINPVFWLETLALLAFGTSWIVKGNMILQDVGEEKKETVTPKN